jgi:hypothetical protein
MKMLEILSPPKEAKLSKVQKASAATPKRRRMANVLDAMLETTKALSPAPTKKIAEAAKVQAEAETRQAEAEAKATKTQAEAEAGPSAPVVAKPATPEEKTAGQIAPEKIGTRLHHSTRFREEIVRRRNSGRQTLCAKVEISERSFSI